MNRALTVFEINNDDDDDNHSRIYHGQNSILFS